MQFMDDAIFALLQSGTVTPHEAFMKAIDKNRSNNFSGGGCTPWRRCRRSPKRRKSVYLGIS